MSIKTDIRDAAAIWRDVADGSDSASMWIFDRAADIVRTWIDPAHDVDARVRRQIVDAIIRAA